MAKRPQFYYPELSGRDNLSVAGQTGKYYDFMRPDATDAASEGNYQQGRANLRTAKMQADLAAQGIDAQSADAEAGRNAALSESAANRQAKIDSESRGWDRRIDEVALTSELGASPYSADLAAANDVINDASATPERKALARRAKAAIDTLEATRRAETVRRYKSGSTQAPTAPPTSEPVVTQNPPPGAAQTPPPVAGATQATPAPVPAPAAPANPVEQWRKDDAAILDKQKAATEAIDYGSLTPGQVIAGMEESNFSTKFHDHWPLDTEDPAFTRSVKGALIKRVKSGVALDAAVEEVAKEAADAYDARYGGWFYQGERQRFRPDVKITVQQIANGLRDDPAFRASQGAGPAVQQAPVK